MKKILILALSLMLISGLCISASAAEESHPHKGDHCVCGGAAVGVGDHIECTDIEWTPLSEALTSVGCTMSTADFGKLPSGNYYLDGDVVVTKESYIGSKSDKLATEPDKIVSLTICLNGYNITRSGGTGKIFGYMQMKSSLTICDCSYDGSGFGGTVAGGTNAHGSIIYTYSDTVLNIYGGNFTGKSTASGGAIVVACDGCGDLDGDNAYVNTKDPNLATASVMNLYNGHISGSTVTGPGGTINLFHYASLNIYGGTVAGGTAGTNGGAITGSQGTIMITGGNIIGGTATNLGGAVYSSSGKLYITGGTMTGGTCKSGLEVVQVIQNDGKVLGTYTTFADGLAKAQNGTSCYMRLLNDLEASDTVSGTLYLDLNGHTLKGIHITGTLYGMDCTTNAYDDSAAGSLIPASGKPQQQVKTTVAQTGAVRRYLTLESEGSYSFHRFYLGITKVTLKPGTVGMGYKATFAGGEKIAAALTPTLGFGYKMWLTDGAQISRGYSADRFEKTQELTLRIDNFLDADVTAEENAKRAEMDVHAVAYLRFADGTEITSTEVCYDLRQMVELADNVFKSYNATKRNALTSLSSRFSQVMLGWDIENTHHAVGSGWEQVDSAKFLKKLTLRSGTTNYYTLAAGSYVLTEDIELGDKKLRIDNGKTVSICLNGHTITTSNRLFEQYGTLNICDCHASDSEGTMLSTLAGETYSPIGYCRFNSVTNLYGGNLKASGKVTSAGVLALSHDGGASNSAKPAAVMNMYGGTVSGGQTYQHGGLISIWNNATFNMYGGELYGGSADGRGGAIDVNRGTINIMGGSIHDNTSGTSGGGIFSDGDHVKINISGATIADNTAANNGGNLHLGKGTYSIADTTITGGQAAKGGGIRIYSCKAAFSNVTLKNNTATELGGAIHASGTTLDLQITGGQITGNTAAESGDGLYVERGSVALAGDVQITDNAADNLYMEFYAAVNTDGLTQGADVRITPEAVTVLGTNEEAISYISSDDSTYTARYTYGNVLLFKNDLTPASAVSGFQVGFGESNITPTTEGIPLAGYSNPSERLSVNDNTRNPDYDDIKAQSVAITDENGTTVILIFADLIRSDAYVFDYIVDAVAAATGVPEEHIFLNMSHSHSVPSVNSTTLPAIVEYNKTLPNLFAQSALQAMNDRAPATMETGSFEVEQTVNGKTQYYNFYRHYSYEEDGIVKYFGDQFGTATYNSTTKPIRDADHTMHLVRFVRDGKDILMSNWRIHPHFTGGETVYKLSADAIGTIRYYMAQKLPDTHYIYFQGAAGNMNETSRLTIQRGKEGLISQDQVQNHGLGYVKYGETVAQIIVDNLGCLESAETGLLQVDHYDYLAKADTPSDEEYAKAKAVYDIYTVETAGMSLSEQNAWVRNYCAENPEYNYVSAFQLSFIVNRRYTQKDTVLPLNVVSLGQSFALFTGPFEMWDSISMEVEEKSPFKTTFCLGYSMDHQHYLVYYPEYLDQEDGVPYVSYESENRHFTAPDTVLDMIEYWTEALNRLYNN